MKTTLNIPDDLMRQVRMRALLKNRKLQETVAELLRLGLACESEEPRTKRVQLPLVHCAHESQEMTPERVAELLLEQETRESLR